MNITKKSFQYGQHTVTIETGRFARQASGAVLISMGDTVLLVTVVGKQDDGEGVSAPCAWVDQVSSVSAWH